MDNMEKDIGIFMPGRLKSERLPNKLLLDIDGTNLWEIACKKLSKLPDKYGKYVLVYDDKLIDIANEYGLNVIKRDIGTTEADGPLTYIYGGVSEIDKTHIMFLNPCLLFLTVETIENSIEEFLNSDADYATSVKKLENWIFDSEGDNLNKIKYKFLSTKDIDPLYQAAHAFHIFNKENFFKDGYMLKKGHQLIEIPEDQTIDVDTRDDFLYAKWRWSLT